MFSFLPLIDNSDEAFSLNLIQMNLIQMIDIRWSFLLLSKLAIISSKTIFCVSCLYCILQYFFFIHITRVSNKSSGAQPEISQGRGGLGILGHFYKHFVKNTRKKGRAGKNLGVWMDTIRAYFTKSGHFIPIFKIEQDRPRPPPLPPCCASEALELFKCLNPVLSCLLIKNWCFASGDVSIESIDCILLSSFEIKAILLISSIKTLCLSLLKAEGGL